MIEARMANKKPANTEARRDEILAEMASIKAMRRGSLNEYYCDQKLKDGTPVRRGPFFNVTAKGKGNKTVSLAVSIKDADAVRTEVDAYRRFKTLAEEYASICEQSATVLGTNRRKG
jgi:hypothetical protein